MAGLSLQVRIKLSSMMFLQFMMFAVWWVPLAGFLGGKLGDMGDFPMAFTICGALCLVAAAIIAGIKAPKHKEAVAA